MKNQNVIVCTILMILTVSIFSCSKKIYRTAYPTLSDGRYDSEFPYKNCSKELLEISEAVTKVFCNSYYKNYYFAPERKIAQKDINKKLLATADGLVELKSTVSGTATVIYYEANRIAILTCWHVVNKQDTIINYFSFEDNPNQKYVQTVSIKQRQEILVYGMPDDGVFDILLKDDENDIAILSKELKEPSVAQISVLKYPFGKAKELEWGSFLYLIGYPMGYKVITRGIVSQPDRDKRGAFLIDALFNRGLSGGILLAVRDGVPNFEVVGITTSAAAETETVLVPERNESYDETIPYEGKIYVNNKKNINYGITKAIAAEAILSLIRENRDDLLKKGFDFQDFLD
jgi:hypothetical protein